MVQPIVNHGGFFFLNEMSEPPNPGAYELFGVRLPPRSSAPAEEEENEPVPPMATSDQ